MSSEINLFRITSRTATELLQLSLRGYDNRRFGVTAIVASGLRQTSLRNIGKHGCLLMSGMPVF
ncbi:hypothetical protein [Prevotella nigrescens]|uniref:hypothetical protein n=1 Tax=Prevotella nigrescens TaxID=28133 RepID=UPI001BA4C4E0|nr:hypothetical protein [Prevotella nigrescens]QUB52699.1 hypothetical protein J5A59_06390 [Prevotella nigrescens]